ncbi:hypothetical protein F3Y30_18150 [Sinorhizobium sp. BG8]|nr:hypothetical protein F3Y30_18150 [Sinorhizobium sp. BG8]
MYAQKTSIPHPADASGGFFLPVPPQQLFPSGGLFTFKTIKGPSLSCGPLFLPEIRQGIFFFFRLNFCRFHP